MAKRVEVSWCGKAKTKGPSPRKINTNPERTLSPIDSYHRTSKKLRAGEVVEEEIQAGLCDFCTGPLMGKKNS